MNQLNLPHETNNNKTVEKQKLKRKKTDMLRSIVNSPWSQSGRRKWRLQWKGFVEKDSFKPGMKEWRGDGWWEWWVDGTDGGSATQRTGWVTIGEIEWLMEGSRELIPIYFISVEAKVIEQLFCWVEFLRYNAVCFHFVAYLLTDWAGSIFF